jgi:hypothetical protein
MLDAGLADAALLDWWHKSAATDRSGEVRRARRGQAGCKSLIQDDQPSEVNP